MFFKLTFRFPTTSQDTYCLLDLWTAKLFLQRCLDGKKVHNILTKEQLLLILLSNWTSLNEEELISYLHILITHESLTPRLSNKHRHTPSLSLFIFFEGTLCLVPSHTYTTLRHFFFYYFTGISYQVGKLNSSETRQGWNCNSGCKAPQHCTLPRCTNVVFPHTFSGSGTVSKT